MKTIDLYNRYQEHIYLESIDDNNWILKGDNDSLGYMRVGYEQDKSINFIDPSGGPFIGKGSKINGKTVTNINTSKDGYIITLKEDESKKD